MTLSTSPDPDDERVFAELQEVSDGLAALQIRLAQILSGRLTPPDSPPDLSRLPYNTTAIIALLRWSPVPMRAREVANGLTAAGRTPPPQLGVVLNDLASRGKITKVATGLYTVRRD
jgi:hypothetical protein